MFLRAILTRSILQILKGDCTIILHNPSLNMVHLHNNSMIKRFAHKCWQCGIERKNLSELFCGQCHFVQGPSETENYFKLFNFQEDYDIDQKELTQKYRGLQTQLHPDKFTKKSAEEKDISEEFSALVNEAYNILQSPLKRAIHLLHLKGTTIEDSHQVEDPEFLMEIMELNEEVENATTDTDLRTLQSKNKTQLDALIKELMQHFKNNNIEQAKKAIIKLKYFNSLSLYINSLMRERGIVD